MSWTHSRAMQVPDRIILTGRDHHVGTTALPRELQLENIVNPPDPEQVRVMTPPRSITLHQHTPHTMNSFTNPRMNIEMDDETLIVENNQARFMSTLPNGHASGMMHGSGFQRVRDTSETADDDADIVQAELQHMRDQISRLSSRLLAVEEEVNATKERENYIVVGALIYIIIHTCSWLFKSKR